LRPEDAPLVVPSLFLLSDELIVAAGAMTGEMATASAVVARMILWNPLI
jgi:hypothetical protein